MYKQDPTFGFLSGIQLKFSNGFTTDMYETKNAKDQPEKTAKVPDMHKDKAITCIKVKYDEFPDRNQYIHGLCFEAEGAGAADHGRYGGRAAAPGGVKIIDLKFCEFRNREDVANIPVGK